MQKQKQVIWSTRKRPIAFITPEKNKFPMPNFNVLDKANYQLHCPLLYDSRRWTSWASTPSYPSLSFSGSAACPWNFWNGICTKVCLSSPVTSLHEAFSKILEIPAIMCSWLQRKVGHGSCSWILHLDAALTLFSAPVKFNDKSVNLSLLCPGCIPSSACAIYSLTFATAFNTPPFFQGAFLITLLNALSLSLSSTASYLPRIHNCGPSSLLNV